MVGATRDRGRRALYFLSLSCKLASMPFNTIQLVYEGAFAALTLNRPDKRNAISYDLVAELLAAFDEIKNSKAKLLIFTGAGKAFCSGMDLDNLRAISTRSPEQVLQDSQKIAQLLRTIYEFPLPTIAAVNGAALGGGCGLATMCDFTIASTEARFGYTEVRIGFLPAIVSAFLIRQIGEKQARNLLLTGRIFDAGEALQLGLVSEVVAPERLLPRSRELAAALLENSPASLRATKRLLTCFARAELDEQLRIAVEENARIRSTEDFREGVSSFLEKRKPHWSER
jgi:methylglutaconyl-CoA hydratase